MLLSDIKNYLLKNVRHRIDINVNVDKFELKDSFGNNLTIETYLHVDEKDIVRSVGKSNTSQTDLKKLDIFSDTARFDVAASILKYAITQMVNSSKAFVRPKIYFHNINEIPAIHFYDPRNSDRIFVRKKFFTEL